LFVCLQRQCSKLDLYLLGNLYAIIQSILYIISLTLNDNSRRNNQQVKKFSWLCLLECFALLNWTQPHKRISYYCISSSTDDVFTLCFVVLVSYAQPPWYDPTPWCHPLPCISPSVSFKASFLSSYIPWKHKLYFFFSRIRSMDSKNGTPEEKGNASPPPRRGQIKAKIGEELRTFVTRGVGRKGEKRCMVAKAWHPRQQATPAPSGQGNVIPSLVFQGRNKKGEGVRFMMLLKLAWQVVTWVFRIVVLIVF